jgi:hypothetical protein
MGADDSSLLRYLDTCKGVAAAYIERATRFNVTDMQVLDARPVIRRFLITIRHELQVTSDVTDYHGVHKPGQGDFGTADWKWYQEQVASQAQSEYTRPETMDSLVHTVKNQAYAAISSKTCIRTHPRRLFHTYKCSGCHGSGKVRCDGCSGSGQVRCGGCSGSGRVSCSTCHGSGTITQYRQVTDYSGHTRSETQHRSCGSCSGGRVSCFSCGGSGKKRCGTCGGSGEVTCGGCSGHGYLTKVTTTLTHTNPTFQGRYPEGTPEYVHAALCKMGFASLASHGEIALDHVDVFREKSSVEFVYQCTMPFCELTVEVRGLTSHWVLFGAQAQIFDAGGVLEELLKSDFDSLAQVATSRSRWLPWFYRSAGRTVAPFMESEVNQMVLDASTEGLASRAIVERVSRSVSEAYIQESLQNLKKIVSAAVNWSRFKWFAVLTVLSIPFSFAAVAYLERDQRIDILSADTHRMIYQPGSSGMLWEMGLVTIPFTLLGWFIAKWISVRWLKKAGGKRTVLWAQRQGILMGKWTALTIIAAAVGAAGAFFNRWPMWIDHQGKGYGIFPLYEPRIPLAAQQAGIEVEKMREERKKAKPKPKPKKTARVVKDDPSPAGSGTTPEKEAVPASE